MQPFEDINLLDASNSFYLLPRQQQIIFLAGVFEGEGWFGIQRNYYKGKPKNISIYNRAALEIAMTDSDIIQRFQYYINTNGHVYLPKRHDGRKQSFKFSIKGYRALHLMEEMLPYLGIRRKEQYYAVVQSIGDGPKNWSSPLLKQTENKASTV